MSGPSNKELLLNATRWLEVFKRERSAVPNLKRVGAIFIFFNQDAIGQGSAVCTATVNKEALKAELKAILKKLGDGGTIVNPHTGDTFTPE